MFSHDTAHMKPGFGCLQPSGPWDFIYRSFDFLVLVDTTTTLSEQPPLQFTSTDCTCYFNDQHLFHHQDSIICVVSK